MTHKYTVALISIIFGLIMTSSRAESPEEAIQESLNYARETGRRATCVLENGYVCKEIVEDSFSKRSVDEFWVPGTYIAAWEIALEDFKNIQDMSADEKRLSHYQIGFTEDGKNIIIYFGAILLPKIVDGVPNGIVLGTFGRIVKYWIDRNSLEITRREFYKT